MTPGTGVQGEPFLESRPGGPGLTPPNSLLLFFVLCFSTRCCFFFFFCFCSPRADRTPPNPKAAIPTGTDEPPVWLKPVAWPTDLGSSEYAQYRWIWLLLFGVSPHLKKQLNLPLFRIGHQNYNLYLWFWQVSGRTWPRDPFQRVGLEKRCRTHPKLAPETNSKAVSWPFSGPDPQLKMQKCVTKRR